MGDSGLWRIVIDSKENGKKVSQKSRAIVLLDSMQRLWDSYDARARAHLENMQRVLNGLKSRQGASSSNRRRSRNPVNCEPNGIEQMSRAIDEAAVHHRRKKEQIADTNKLMREAIGKRSAKSRSNGIDTNAQPKTNGETTDTVSTQKTSLKRRCDGTENGDAPEPAKQQQVGKMANTARSIYKVGKIPKISSALPSLDVDDKIGQSDSKSIPGNAVNSTDENELQPNPLSSTKVDSTVDQSTLSLVDEVANASTVVEPEPTTSSNQIDSLDSILQTPQHVSSAMKYENGIVKNAALQLEIKKEKLNAENDNNWSQNFEGNSTAPPNLHVSM